MNARALVLVAAIAASGCASNGPGRDELVPFHIALVPIGVTTVPGSADEEDEDGGGLPPPLDGAATSRALALALERDGFTCATVLDPPDGVAADEFAAWSTERRDEHWVRAGAAAGADVLLECELRVGRRIESRRNEKFWLNLPVFLIGGPFSWFVSDRTYEVDGRLFGRLHELNALAAEEAGLGDRSAELLRLTATFEGTDLDLVDRAGPSPTTYLLSLVVPPGFLAREGERVAGRVAAALVEDLASGVAGELRRGRASLVDADRIASFYLEPGTEVRREGGRLSVRGEVVVRRQAWERMEELVVAAGEARRVAAFGEERVDREESTRRMGVVRVPFETELELVGDPQTVRVELLGGGRQLALRSYTFPIPRD
jgi:hypothetical protein